MNMENNKPQNLIILMLHIFSTFKELYVLWIFHVCKFCSGVTLIFEFLFKSALFS